jgi:hypothetical protein
MKGSGGAPQVVASDGGATGRRSAGPRRSTRGATPGSVALGLGSGVLFTSLSLVVAWLVVRLAFGSDLDGGATMVLTAVTLAGGCAGSWWAQPRFARLSAAVSRRLRRAVNQQR